MQRSFTQQQAKSDGSYPSGRGIVTSRPPRRQYGDVGQVLHDAVGFGRGDILVRDG